MQKGNYFRPYKYIDGKAVYIHKGPNDLGKTDIPMKDRCEGFDDMWNMIFKQVMEYWDWVPVENVHEFDQYEHEDEEE